MDANRLSAGIAAKLKDAKANDVGPFGAEKHCFRLQPVLTEPQLAKFEAIRQLMLPRPEKENKRRIGFGRE